MMSTILATPNTHALPWAEQFFAGAIQSRHLAHAYVLKGKISSAMYQMALQVAKVLNCQNRPSGSGFELEQLACGQCTQCKWISANSHPAVLTVSRLTYQVNDKGELMTLEELEKQAKKNQATQIKTDQIGRLIQQLGISSEATRVVIFTDAEELPASMPSDVIAPFDWRSVEANEEKSFHIRPLTRDIFNAFSVNKFLKTLEEPPQKTLFFFIAETEEQLLETIVSRCQVVPCQSSGMTSPTETVSPEVNAFVDELFRRAQQGQDAYALANEFENFFTAAGLTMLQALQCLQQQVRSHWVQQYAGENFGLYRELQEKIENANRMLDAKTNETQVILNLFLQFSSLLKQQVFF
jgi:hypothetical protein